MECLSQGRKETICWYNEKCDSLSIGAAIENLILEATNLGLGTLWIANTCFAYDALVQFIDTKDQLVGTVAVGYADESPEKRPRKNMDDVLEYRWCTEQLHYYIKKCKCTKNSNAYCSKNNIVVKWHYQNSCNTRKQGVILWKLREIHTLNS